MNMDCYFLILILCLHIIVRNGHGYQQNKRTDSCSYTFKVWYPERNVLERMRTIEFKMANVSNHIEKEFLVIKHNSLSELRDCQNWTSRLERDIMALRLSEFEQELKGKDLEKEFTEFKKTSENVTRQLVEFQTELHNLRRRDHKKRMVGTGDSDGMLVSEEDISFNDVRDTVVDLKAEWILVKRDIFKLQSELQKFTNSQIYDFNKTRIIQDRVKQLSHATHAVQKKLEHSETRVRILNSNFDRLKQIVAGKMVKIEDIKTELEEVKSEIKNIKSEFKTKNTDGDGDIAPQQMVQPIFYSKVKHKPADLQQQTVSVPSDCDDIRRQGMQTSGVYQIRPRGSIYVESIYCEFVNDTAYNVIQRRFDGLLGFERGWVEYKYGFGSLYSDHWLGNEIVHLLSNQRHYILRIDIWDWEGGRAYAEYSVFSIDNEANKYTLKVSGYSGDAGDSLSYHNGLKFSTEDNDNDVNIRSCAKDNKSGWWFESCFLANLNGVYRKGWYTHKQSTSSDGIVWYTLKNSESYSLKKVEMKMFRAMN